MPSRSSPSTVSPPTAPASASGWGGARRGAGRKPQGPRILVPHLPRPPLSSVHPAHVTLRLQDGIPSLRTRKLGRLVFAALATARERFGMRVTHFSVQGNHLHLIVEAAGQAALSRAMHGLAIRLAKRLNARLGRRGAVFSDRYFARALRTPLQVRRALLYVMNNYRRHWARSTRPPQDWADPYSSVDYFDGFRRLPSGRVPRAEFSLARDPPVVAPRTYLLSKGWRALGLLRLDDVPGGAARP